VSRTFATCSPCSSKQTPLSVLHNIEHSYSPEVESLKSSKEIEQSSGSTFARKLPPLPWGPWEAEAVIFAAWAVTHRRGKMIAKKVDASGVGEKNGISNQAMLAARSSSFKSSESRVRAGCMTECDEGYCSTTAGDTPSSDGTSSDSTASSDNDLHCAGPSAAASTPSAGCNATMRARLSPLMAKVLRHSASSLGLQLSGDGFALVSNLLALPIFMELGFTAREVQHVVNWEKQASKKQRFALRTGPRGLEVRANQGHSDPAVDGSLLTSTMSVQELPATLMHGTYFRNISSILIQGLRPMGRHHIHLFLPSDGVGRRTAEVLIYVDVCIAAAQGIEFLRADNGVVLSTGGTGGAIPPACFSKVVRILDGKLLYSPEQPNETHAAIMPYVPPHLRDTARSAPMVTSECLNKKKHQHTSRRCGRNCNSQPADPVAEVKPRYIPPHRR